MVETFGRRKPLLVHTDAVFVSMSHISDKFRLPLTLSARKLSFLAPLPLL